VYCISIYGSIMYIVLSSNKHLEKRTFSDSNGA